MRCLRPVSRLKTVLLPEFGLPTTAMLALGSRRTEMSDKGMRVSVALVNGLARRDGKAPGLLLAERNTATEQTELHRITAECAACEFDFGTFHKAKHHQALDQRVRRIDCCDDPFLATFQGCERFAITVHSMSAFNADSRLNTGFSGTFPTMAK